MKKLIWLICLSMLLGLFAGCHAAPGETTKPTGMTASGATTTPEPTDPGVTTVPQPTEPVDIRPLPPENPGSSLIDYDPDRQIYIASESVYMDYYLGVSSIASFGFDIYSRQSLDPEEISVIFPVDLPFEVYVYENVVTRKPAVTVNGATTAYLDFPYYLYLAYRGETFEEGEAVSAVDLVSGRYERKDGEEIELRYRDFMSLKEEDLPEFYVYNIVIGLYNITQLQETVVLDKLDVTIGDESYEAKLGCVRLLPQEAFPTDATVADWDGKSGNFCQLYNDGIFRLLDVFPMEEAQEDITITGLRIAEEATRILDITVFLTSGGQSIEMQWDGTSPIYLYKGDSIDIDVVVKNEYAGKLLNDVVSHAIVEYTNSANEQLCAVSTQTGTQGRQLYEYYAIIFDGLDMEPYYRNYFYKATFQWLDEYRGK